MRASSSSRFPIAVLLVVGLSFGACGCDRSAARPSSPHTAPRDVPVAKKVGPLVTSVDGPGAGRAWIELVPVMVLGEDPLQIYSACFHAEEAGGGLVTIPDVTMDKDDEDLITWISDRSVLFANAYHIDVSAGTATLLPVAVPGARLSPDNQEIAFWKGSGDQKGVAIYSLPEDKTQWVARFEPDDWGIGELSIGVLPRIAWLCDNILLFDAPWRGMPCILSYDRAAAEVGVFRPRAWGIRVSADGRYAAYAPRERWGGIADGQNQLVIEDLVTDDAVTLNLDGDALSARVWWSGPDLVAVLDGKALRLYQCASGEGLALISDVRVTGDVVAVRPVAHGIEYTELIRQSGIPIGCVIGTLVDGRE